MSEERKLIIYMPALNEEESIFGVIKSIPREFKNCKLLNILVVDDGSKDGTRDHALEAGAVVISHHYNKGLGAAFRTAVDYALQNNADILVSMDSDGQFNAEEIQKLIEPILNNRADFSLGNRFGFGRPRDMPKLKYWGNHKISRAVSFISRHSIRDVSCGFRAYSRDCFMSLNLQGRFTYTHEAILDLLDKDYNVEQVPIQVRYFKERVSRVANNLFRYGIRTSKIILKCYKDYQPFYFFFAIALAVFILSLAFGAFVIIHWTATGFITPYKSIGIFALALLGMSLLLLILALVADMLNRIRRNQEKILYLVKKNRFDQN